MFQLSSVTCHLSPVICHLSPVTSNRRQQPQSLPLLTPPLCTVVWFTKTEPKTETKKFKPKISAKPSEIKLSSFYPILAINSSTKGPQSTGKRGFQEQATKGKTTNVQAGQIQWGKKANCNQSLYTLITNIILQDICCLLLAFSVPMYSTLQTVCLLMQVLFKLV